MSFENGYTSSSDSPRHINRTLRRVIQPTIDQKIVVIPQRRERLDAIEDAGPTSIIWQNLEGRTHKAMNTCGA